jgi:phospholipid-binding lipoprotein MlaA
MRANTRQSLWWLIAVLVVFVSAGPGLVPPAGAEGGAAGLAGAPAGAQVAVATVSPAPEQTTQGTLEGEPVDSEDYDPWEPFNERTFRFNWELDRYVIKPAATGWNKVAPDEVQRGLGRMFENVGMPRRFLNSLLQLKVDGAGRELARFLLNSTFGFAGFLDVATTEGIESSDEDTGQTLAVWGVGPGPYLVIPFLPPMTVRDGIGSAVDGLLNPVSYFAPFAASAGMKASDTVNGRSLNLEVFEDIEEGTLDMYSAVRNGYLQRREKAIRE